MNKYITLLLLLTNTFLNAQTFIINTITEEKHNILNDEVEYINDIPYTFTFTTKLVTATSGDKGAEFVVNTINMLDNQVEYICYTDEGLKIKFIVRSTVIAVDKYEIGILYIYRKAH